MSNKPLSKIVVTGGAGMVGTTMVPIIAGLADEIYVLDNHVRGRTRHDIENVFWFDVDVTKSEAEQFYRDADAVVNLAASVGGYMYNADNAYHQLMDNIALQFVPVIHASRAAVPTFIQFSSACVYPVGYHGSRDPNSINWELGEDNELYPNPVERHSSGVPDPGYSNAKQLGEIAVDYPERFGGTREFTRPFVFRPDNIGGPWDYGDERGHVLPVLVRRMAAAQKTGEPVIVNNYNCMRGFVHADDVSHAVALALTGMLEPNVYNVGLEDPITIWEAAKILRYHIAPHVELVGGVISDTAFSRWVNNQRLREEGWKPAYKTSAAVVAAYGLYYAKGMIYLG